jgi:hypothetical protein
VKPIESRLKWNGTNLYRVRGKRHDFVGTVVRNLPLSDRDGWNVWIRGEAVDKLFPSIEDAKAFLERIA